MRTVSGDKIELQSIDDVLVVVRLGAGLVRAGKGVWEDKKIDYTDLQHIMPVLPLIEPAVRVIGRLPATLGELTNEQITELKAKFNDEFGEGRWEKAGEYAFRAALNLVGMVNEIRQGALTGAL